MQFTTGLLTACPGGEHLKLPVTIGGNEHELVTTKQEVTSASPEGFSEIRSALIARLRSAVFEAGASTPLQVRNAVSNKTFSA